MLKRFGGSANQAGPKLAHVGKQYSINGHQVVVEDVIAEGGFGVVYQVRSTASGEKLALKRMAVNNEQDLFLCRQEVAITKALSNCVHSVTYVSSSIRQVSADVHEICLLLHLYTGPKLVDMMNQNLSTGLSQDCIVKIFTDICDAVSKLHHRTKPITHRDLKVENVLQTRSGEFVLCDYGSCSVSSMDPREEGVSLCEDQIGRFTTLAYRAPEMVDLYSGKVISTKADIWALGCLLYKLCFFVTPFGEQPLAILSGTFNIPESSKYTDELHSLIGYMLQADPDKRPNIFQVCEVAFKLRRTKNPISNVFNSPLPSDLPKVSLTPSSYKQSTPVRPSNKTDHVPTITMTTISSRDRPRVNRHHPLGHSSSTSRLSTPSVAPPTPSSTPLANSSPLATHHLPHVSRSMGSGLDAFGLTPFVSKTNESFSTSSTGDGERHLVAVARSTMLPSSSSSSSSPPPLLTANDYNTPQAPFVDVQRDLFGATPFSKSVASHEDASTMDAFGSRPFVSTVRT